MSQNTNSNSNSASVTVKGPTGVTGPRVVKFGYKEFLQWKVSDDMQGVGTETNAFRTKWTSQVLSQSKCH